VRAVALDYQTRSLDCIDVPDPKPPEPDQVLFRVLATGVCGTDRDLAEFRFGYPPPGDHRLVLGHEAIGQVIATGSSVPGLKPGDWVAPMVRRSCSPACESCARGRRDLCLTGQYTERGIMGAHGYFSQYAVDRHTDLVPVPAGIVDVAVLAEPLSVVEKAVDLGLRLHPGNPQTALVLGAGTIGILAALVLQEMGLRVVVRSAEPVESGRAALLRSGELEYTDAGGFRAGLVLEATGSPAAAMSGLDALEPLGVLIILGAPKSEGELSFRDLLVGNRVIAGSVNAAPHHWAAAMRHLAVFDRRFLERLITRMPFEAFRESIAGAPAAKPKIVHIFD
jgi:glucose 1-dehydrogenase